MATDDESTDDRADFGQADLISLGEKLASLELNDAERAALDALINSDEVSGFGRYGGGLGARLNIAGGVRVGFRKGLGTVVSGPIPPATGKFAEGDPDRPFEF